jgi:hypothetical protein
MAGWPGGPPTHTSAFISEFACDRGCGYSPFLYLISICSLMDILALSLGLYMDCHREEVWTVFLDLCIHLILMGGVILLVKATRCNIYDGYVFELWYSVLRTPYI